MKNIIPISAFWGRMFQIVFGLLFMSFGFFGLWRDYQSTQYYTAKATGMVAGETVRNYAGEINNRVTYNYDTLIRFTTQEGKPIKFYDHQYEHNPFFVVDQQVPVLYDPRNPQNAELEGTKKSARTGAIVTLVVGLLFFGIALMRLWRDWRKRSTIAWLIKNGDVIQTDYVDMMPSQHGIWITSQWQDPGTGIMRTFISAPINFPPLIAFITAWMSDKQSTHEAMPAASTPEGFRSRLLSYLPPSQKIAVYVDPHDPTRYYMDTSFFPLPK